MARDAQSAGDRVACEGFMQYAEHYLRVLNAAQEGRNNSNLSDNKRVKGNGQDARPEGGQQAAASESGDRANSGNGGGNGGSQPEPTLGDSGGPVPEMLKGPAESSGDADQTLDEMDKDPMETESAVN